MVENSRKMGTKYQYIVILITMDTGYIYVYSSVRIQVNIYNMYENMAILAYIDVL